jgi:HPt (histidine-containing phosphotransfer) domain-containing protein
MRIKWFKFVGIIAFYAVGIVCISLLAWLKMVLAAVCFLFLLAVSTAAYYRIDKKRSRFKAHKDTIRKGCGKQSVKAEAADISRTDGVVNQAVRAGTSNDEVETDERETEITSFLADDPSYHKMIDMFVNSLPKRLEEMQEALDEGNLQDLTCKVRALKGLGGFAGFSIYAEKAKDIEMAVADNQVDKVRRQLDEMVRLCLKTKPAHR